MSRHRPAIVPTSADAFPSQTPMFLYMPVPIARGVTSDPLLGAVAGVFPARLVGYRLYRAAILATSIDPMGFVAVEVGYAVTGRLFVVHPGQYGRVLGRLDRAFGFVQGDPDSLYVRRSALVDWVVDDAAVTLHAWVYEGGIMLNSRRHLCEPVAHGDWSRWLAGVRARQDGAPGLGWPAP